MWVDSRPFKIVWLVSEWVHVSNYLIICAELYVFFILEVIFSFSDAFSLIECLMMS